jgi:hypothetical protein
MALGAWALVWPGLASRPMHHARLGQPAHSERASSGQRSLASQPILAGSAGFLFFFFFSFIYLFLLNKYGSIFINSYN